MRKVKFNKFIQDLYEREGSGTWEEDYPNEGMFLGWGTVSKHEQGWTNVHTTALVELPDGTIEQVLPERIKFVHPSFIETKVRPDDPNEFWKQYSQNPEQPINAESLADQLIERLGINPAYDHVMNELCDPNTGYDVELYMKLEALLRTKLPRVNLWKLKDDTKKGEE